MSDRRLFDHDESTGLTEWFIGTDEGFIIETVQDVEPLIEANKRAWNSTEKHTRYGEWTRIASFPPVIIMELAKKQILRMDGSILDEKKYCQWLDDPANRHWRTRAGKV